MTPTNLPALPVPVATLTPAVPSVIAAGQSQTTDFMLMLGQLLAASGAPTAAGVLPPQKNPLVSGADAELKKDEIDPDALLAMFSIALPPPQPVGFNAPSGAGLSVSGSDAGASSRSLDAALASMASEVANAELFAAVVEEVAPASSAELPQRADSFQLPTSAELQQQARALTAQEALSRPVHVPVGNAAWANEIGSRLLVMTESGTHTASLRLSPEHLGPLEISIVVRDDKTSVWFGAAHADTRAAIETALPRLREMFEAQGLSLADAGVFRESPRDQAAPTTGTTSSERGDTSEEVTTASGRARLGLLDTYA